jgi:hypothetical protein
MRRRLLPTVVPKPRSNGSTTKRPKVRSANLGSVMTLAWQFKPAPANAHGQ